MTYKLSGTSEKYISITIYIHPGWEAISAVIKQSNIRYKVLNTNNTQRKAGIKQTQRTISNVLPI
jgi:hypothetical protein